MFYDSVVMRQVTTFCSASWMDGQHCTFALHKEVIIAAAITITPQRRPSSEQNWLLLSEAWGGNSVFCSIIH